MYIRKKGGSCDGSKLNSSSFRVGSIKDLEIWYMQWHTLYLFEKKEIVKEKWNEESTCRFGNFS